MIRFEDGAGYERMMGIWSRLVGEVFVDWLAPPLGLRWIDVGCGNGAFTELLVERCAPVEVQGIDPSEGQLAFARTRPAACRVTFHLADAMALPCPADSFDAAVMALAIVFVPDPVKGLEEMVRVVRPGGLIASYMWDMTGGGFPLDPILVEMRAMGLTPPRPPQVEVSRVARLRDLWMAAGLEDVETREVTVQRTFASFDEFWLINLAAPTVAAAVADLASGEIETLKDRVRTRLSAESGSITYCARANAIKGHLPK
ncbi:MAG: class I SAM-dependent methyltransferase [Reyranella sp.]|uniref:class I SAM-dependent methyltransferase n=1 Tax=Reyranella sp. TaxID=1929291 RepID=UPI003D1373F4